MNIRDAQIITDINATRARYGFGPLLACDEESAIEERGCDEIARLWTLSFAGVEEFMARLPEIRTLLDCNCEIEYRRGRIDLCGIVDTWTIDFGMDSEDFDRLVPEIESWIRAHMSACGRYKLILR